MIGWTVKCCAVLGGIEEWEYVWGGVGNGGGGDRVGMWRVKVGLGGDYMDGVVVEVGKRRMGLQKI